MSKKNFLRWMFAALFGFVAMAFTACSEADDDTIQAPEFSVSTKTLNFDERGGYEVVQITANCLWQIDNYPAWVTVTPTRGEGNGTIEISVGESTSPRTGEISFMLIHELYGQWGKDDDKISIVQTVGGEQPITEAIYANDFDKEAATKDYGTGQSYPYLNQFDGWINHTGSGVGSVTYSYNGMSARSNSTSDGSYSDYSGSGENNLFFGKNAYFKIEQITLPESLNYHLSFGAEKYSQDYGSLFSTEEFTVRLSNDGVMWSKPIEIHSNITAEGRWNTASADFTLPEGTSTLWIRFAASVASAYRLDDVELTAGEGGEQILFDQEEDSGSDTPINPDVKEGPYTSDSLFVVEADDSGNACYTLGTTQLGDHYVTGFKLGKSKVAGLYTSPALGIEGNKYLSFYAVAWNNKSATVYVEVDGRLVGSYVAKSNVGAKDNAPYNALVLTTEDFTSIALTGLTSQSVIRFSTSADFTTAEDPDNNCRAIVCGVKLTDQEVTPQNSTSDAPAVKEALFTKVSAVESGKEYVLVAAGTVNAEITANYGYMQVISATEENGQVMAPESSAITITAVEGGYTLKQADGRYLYLKGDYTSFNLDAAPSEGDLFTIEPQEDGTFIITNVEKNKSVQYDSQYNSYGVYPDHRGIYPALYVKGEGGQTPEPPTPSTPELEGDGLSCETAYTLADLVALYNAGTTPTGVWVKGVIAGSYDNNGVTASYVETNLALQSGDIVVPVQLPKGNVRDALNLVGNPENLNAEVALLGDIMQYFSVAGLKNVTDYVLSIEVNPDPEPKPEEVISIAEVLALGTNAKIGNVKIEGYVVSNMELNNLTSKKGLYVQDETGALQFYLEANHELKFGDKVQIDLNEATLGAYNGAVQISGLSLDKITTLSSGNTVEAKVVTIADFLANKYEGQYIALEQVQVASADLSKSWVMDERHTSIKMESATGEEFVVFSSKYATYGAEQVAQGSGTIKGISSINNGTMQLIFAQNSDYAALTEERFGATETPDPEPEPGVVKATVAEFLAAAEDATIYELTGTITSVANTTYGNFYLKDETGEVYIYGLCSPTGAQKYWAESGVKVGDTITVQTVRTSYNGEPQGKNAIYVSHVAVDLPDPNPGVEYDATITFVNQGYENAQKVDGDTIALDENISVVFKQGSASTAPAYYDSGEAIRMYQNGATLDVTASNGKTITAIELTFSNNQYYLAADGGTLSEEAAVRTWKGSASSVKFTSTGTDKNHRAYISAIKVAYE